MESSGVRKVGKLRKVQVQVTGDARHGSKLRSRGGVELEPDSEAVRVQSWGRTRALKLEPAPEETPLRGEEIQPKWLRIEEAVY